MAHRKMRGPFPWLASVFAVNVALTVGAAYALSRGVVAHENFTALAMVSVAGAAVMFALSWKIVDFQMVRGIRRMAAEVRAIAHGGAREGIDPDRFPMVSPLPEAVNEICSRMAQVRKELSEGLSAATARSEETSIRLAAILNDLHEGVVVCNLRHQVVLYNQVAVDILQGEAGQLGLGRSLFDTVAREPVLHMMDVLSHRPDLASRGIPFLAGSADGHRVLQARMTLIRSGTGEITGHVVTLVDAGPQVAALAQRDVLLREVSEGMVTPLARLREANGDPDLVEREAEIISRAIKRVTDGYQKALTGWWPMTDLHSPDLFTFVARRFEGEVVKVNPTGLPIWLHVDSHSLVLTLEFLIRQIIGHTGIGELDLAASGEDDCACLEIIWSGVPVSDQVMEEWLSQTMPVLGGMSVGDVLLHHAGTAISQECREGWACLHIPMHKGVEVQAKPKEILPTRPEFYDLSLLERARDTGSFGDMPLRALTFVVFDTETTGLKPSEGDQMVQIGAVRVVNGRILSGEGFDRLLHPGRSIPKESIRFHGITDDMVRDKPPVGVILPQFKAYCADSVLVAHNAAFDLKFLKMRERECGVSFDNPVLDTMMLSNYLDGPDARHSLDAICDRYGIEITDRHTALGDAIVTAAVLLRQIEALEHRGLITLNEVVKSLDLTMKLRQQAMAF